jgi:hypothetical protein
MGTQRVQLKGVLSLVGYLGLSYRYERFLSCLGCFSWSSTKYFFHPVHYFNFFVHIVQQAGQAAVLGRLSLSISLKILLPSMDDAEEVGPFPLVVL